MNIFDWNARLDKEVASNSLYRWVAKTKGIDAARAMAESAIRNRFDKRYGAGPAAKILSPDKAPAGYKVPIDELRPRLELSASINRVVNQASKFNSGTAGILRGDTQAQIADARITQRENLLNNIAKNRAALSASKFKSPDLAVARDVAQRAGEEIAEQKENDRMAAQFRSMIDIERMKREHRRNFMPPRKTENSKEGKIEQKIITKGVQRAFGGSRLGFLRDIFGYGFGWGRIAKSIVGAMVDRSRYAQSMHLAAMSAGVSDSTMRGLGIATKIFGGSEQDAASILSSINAFTHGSRFGYGFGQLENLYRFGVRIHPGMSAEDILYSIADRYSRLSIGDRAVMARETGLPAALQDMMREGAESFIDKWQEYKRYQPSDEQQVALRENSIAINEFTASLNTLKDETLVGLTGFIKNCTTSIDFLTETMRWFKGGEGYSDVGSFISDNTVKAGQTQLGLPLAGIFGRMFIPSYLQDEYAASQPRNVRHWDKQEIVVKLIAPDGFDATATSNGAPLPIITNYQ